MAHSFGSNTDLQWPSHMGNNKVEKRSRSNIHSTYSMIVFGLWKLKDTWQVLGKIIKKHSV